MSKETEDELRVAAKKLFNGHSHEDIMNVVCDLLAQTIADMAPRVTDAMQGARVIGDAVAQDIERNWHLVTAKRARG